jgi:type III pantothenate kinase
MEKPAFLAIDVGNSTVKGAVWSEGEWSAIERAEPFIGPEAGWGEFVERIVGGRPFMAGMASVAPEVAGEISDAIERMLGEAPAFVRGRMQVPRGLHPFRTRYETPDTLGADRLAAAAAAYWHYGRPAGRAVLVVDAGTAVTLDAITARGAHLGGAILPGPEALIRSLSRGTAQLPVVPWAPTAEAIGTTSITSIQSGLTRLLQHGLAGLVADTLAELPGAIVVGTGGWAPYLSEFVDFDELDEYLVLEGVRLLSGAMTSGSG